MNKGKYETCWFGVGGSSGGLVVGGVAKIGKG